MKIHRVHRIKAINSFYFYASIYNTVCSFMQTVLVFSLYYLHYSLYI